MVGLTRVLMPAVVAALSLGAVLADDPKNADKTPLRIDVKTTVMQKKLVQAQKLLEGLALADFAKIKSAADELVVLRQQAGWTVRRTVKYDVFSNDFQRNLEAVQKAAKNKNVDAAALAYVDMTLTCVKCHQYVREEVVGLVPQRSGEIGIGVSTHRQ